MTHFSRKKRKSLHREKNIRICFYPFFFFGGNRREKGGRWGSRRPNLSSSAKKRGWERESQTLLFLLYLPQHPRALKRNKFRMQILFRTAALLFPSLFPPFPPSWLCTFKLRTGGKPWVGLSPFPSVNFPASEEEEEEEEEGDNLGSFPFPPPSLV